MGEVILRPYKRGECESVKNRETKRDWKRETEKMCERERVR